MSSSLFPVAIEFAQSRNLTDVAFAGKGAYKETFRAIDPHGMPLALKLLEPSKCNLARSEREIAALKKCESPLIASLYDYGEFVTSSGYKYYFSTEEYLDGGTLNNQLKRTSLTPDTIRQYAKSLVHALDYLKNANLVHRDIKPDNIMFRSTRPEPVLVDFGLVRDLSESSLTLTWLPQGPGTPYYAAPEQLNNDKQLIGWRTDQFCVGVVLAICLTGRHPFEAPGDTPPQVIETVARRRPCADPFKAEARLAGFDWLIKTLGVWPIQRYSTPRQILESIEA